MIRYQTRHIKRKWLVQGEEGEKDVDPLLSQSETLQASNLPSTMSPPSPQPIVTELVPY